jgi:hypothetical protein
VAYDYAAKAKASPAFRKMAPHAEPDADDKGGPADHDADDMHDPDKYLDDAFAAAKRGDRKEFDAMVTAWKNC